MISSRSSFSRALFAVALFSGLGCAGVAPRGAAPVATEWANKNLVILPFENLSGESVPLRELRESLGRRLRSMGLAIRDDATMNGFMAAHRLRYVGGIDDEAARALQKEIQASAVLVTTVELYKRNAPPRIALVCRLVSTGDDARILWMDRVALAGDDHPGILGLGLITDPTVLSELALKSLTESLEAYLSGEADGGRETRLQPRLSYRAKDFRGDRAYTVAVMPFFNRSLRKNAGEIVALHFVNQLVKSGSLTVLEPGVVRQRLLRSRVVMTEGISSSDADLISASFGADLVVTGTAREYEDAGGLGGEPKVDFSAQVINAKTRRVVWSSRSYATGREGVILYDWGAIGTASSMTAGMAGAIVERLARGN
jgi:TolB-like protein